MVNNGFPQRLGNGHLRASKSSHQKPNSEPSGTPDEEGWRKNHEQEALPASGVGYAVAQRVEQEEKPEYR
jgi:hypothetical protein